MRSSFSSGLYMVGKKSKDESKSKSAKKPIPKSSKKKKAKSKSKKPKKNEFVEDDAGIVVIDEDLKVDKDAELEARKAYLEEARSQEAFD